MLLKSKLAVLLLCLILPGVSLNAQVKVTSALFGSLTARQIGPAPMSGRITSIDAVNKDPRIMYIGAAGGGVWKTDRSFDKYARQSGDKPKNPDEFGWYW
jgi:hypothetical protein